MTINRTPHSQLRMRAAMILSDDNYHSDAAREWALGFLSGKRAEPETMAEMMRRAGFTLRELSLGAGPEAV